ncbi:MAG: dynamin family protein [Peptococcaceae bacterium]|nr:dynamin family protein [Peptococcaceae bacterium]
MQPENRFETSKNIIHNNYRLLGEQLNDLGFLPRIVAAEEKLYREKMQLLIVGEFSRGKSTLINAILGQPVLPSKVTPATAVINTIQGGTKPQMRISDHNGQSTDIDLPNEKINKFLDRYLTTANEQASAIKRVSITLPGRLEKWGFEIVDTPGVNDLDEAREELTFEYLTQSDACLMILDGQQPLSKSEINFLQYKVLPKDISRVFFVINRMDEVNPAPDEATNQRLFNYVHNLLSKTVESLPNPEIFLVSSKETLRSRYQNTASPWLESFEEFEAGLLRFVINSGCKGRLPDHVERAMTIAHDGNRALEERLQLLAADGQESAQIFTRLRQREEQLQKDMNELTAFMELVIPELSDCIRSTATDSFIELRERLGNYINLCDNNDDIAALKANTSEGIRRSIEEILEIIKEFREELRINLSQRFADLYEEELIPVEYQIPQYISNKDIELSSFPQPEQSEATASAKRSSTGGIMGFVGSVLIGPMDFVAKVASLFVKGRIMQEQDTWEVYRIRTTEILREQIDEIIHNAEQHSLEIARYEIVPFLNKISERINSRLRFIRLTIEQEKSILGNKVKNIIEEKTLLENRRENLHKIMRDLIKLQGELQ